MDAVIGRGIGQMMIRCLAPEASIVTCDDGSSHRDSAHGHLSSPSPSSSSSSLLRLSGRPQQPPAMSDNSTSSNSTDSGTPDLSDILPPYLNIPAHLSAHKYFFVCTLTVAAWDTLVLSPRTWRLLRTKEWPPLKILFHFLRLFMPIEFTIVGEFSLRGRCASRLRLLTRMSQVLRSSTPSGHKR